MRARVRKCCRRVIPLSVSEEENVSLRFFYNFLIFRGENPSIDKAEAISQSVSNAA